MSQVFKTGRHPIMEKTVSMKHLPMWLCLGGFGSAGIGFGLFFGGSDRDATWIWTLFVLGFYGGLLGGFIGGIWWMFQTPVDLSAQDDHRRH